MHRFNNAVDRTIARPLAKAYVEGGAAPGAPGREQFLQQPRPAGQRAQRAAAGQAQAGRAVARPLPAQLDARHRRHLRSGLRRQAAATKSEDFGQTLGVWGWKRSRYVELPLFGPRTVRDMFGLVGDAPLSPIRQVEDDKIRFFLQGLQLVDVRAQLLSIDSLREGADRRIRAVPRRVDAAPQLPDRRRPQERRTTTTRCPTTCAKTKTIRTVPVDAMPVMPTDWRLTSGVARQSPHAAAARAIRALRSAMTPGPCRSALQRERCAPNLRGLGQSRSGAAARHAAAGQRVSAPCDTCSAAGCKRFAGEHAASSPSRPASPSRRRLLLGRQRLHALATALDRPRAHAGLVDAVAHRVELISRLLQDAAELAELRLHRAQRSARLRSNASRWPACGSPSAGCSAAPAAWSGRPRRCGTSRCSASTRPGRRSTSAYRPSVGRNRMRELGGVRRRHVLVADALRPRGARGAPAPSPAARDRLRRRRAPARPAGARSPRAGTWRRSAATPARRRVRAREAHREFDALAAARHGGDSWSRTGRCVNTCSSKRGQLHFAEHAARS